MADQVREDGKSAEEAHKWFNPVLVFGSAYFFFVGWLYLLGFWGHFDVNVFEYLGFNDVLKLGTSHPGTLFFLALGVVFTVWMPQVADLSRGEPERDELGKRVRMFAPILATLWLVLLLVVVVLDNELLWRTAGFLLICVPAGVFLMSSQLLGRYIPSHRTRIAVSFLAVGFPVISYVNGLGDAQKIISWTGYNCVADVSLGNFGIPTEAARSGCIRYVGVADGYIFLLMPDSKSIHVAKWDSVKSVELYRSKGVPKMTVSAPAVPKHVPANSHDQQHVNPSNAASAASVNPSGTEAQTGSRVER